jgi:hypothetical protein
VDDDTADSNRLRSLKNADRSVAKQRSSETPPPIRSIHCETRHSTTGIGSGMFLQELARDHCLRNNTRSEGIIADDRLPFAHHVRSRGRPGHSQKLPPGWRSRNKNVVICRSNGLGLVIRPLCSSRPRTFAKMVWPQGVSFRRLFRGRRSLSPAGRFVDRC